MQIDEMEALLGKKIVTAYLLGMSVIEITRAMQKYKINRVHSVLRNAGHIRAVTRDEFRTSYAVHRKLDAALERRGCCFARWCLGWKFNLDDTADLLKESPDKGNPTAAHEALRRDFPVIYFKMYGGDPPKKPLYNDYPTIHPSVLIEWDAAHIRYIAKVVEEPDIEAVGYDLDDALKGIKWAYSLLEDLGRLDSAITHRSKYNHSINRTTLWG
jgi:predicted RNase H-like HicB family nuclease